MNEIIKIERVEGKETVSARDLHSFLEVQSKFADWFKNRVEKYGFEETTDFLSFSKNLESGGTQVEYRVRRKDSQKSTYIVKMVKKSIPESFGIILRFED